MESHSPPATPAHSRPGAVSAMSYASNKSHKSHKSLESKFKLDLTESPKDKRRLAGKADPTKALSEAQPAAVALEDSNLENLRTMSHKDKDGTVIMDPDRSNPTRPRMERPLDTIRSFNAAAEGTTSRRHSYQRPASQYNPDVQNRRGSYYGSQHNNPYSPNGRAPPVRPGQGGYYKNNSYNVRPESFAEEGQQQYQQGPPPPPRHARFQSAQYAQNQESPNSIHSHQPSYETMTSGSDEMSKSTNPSSQNSSFDQLHQMGMRKPDEYGHNPHRQNGVSNGMRNPYPPSAMNNVRPNGQTNGQMHVYTNGRVNSNNQNGQANGHTNGYQTDDYGFEFGDRPVPPPKNLMGFPTKQTYNAPGGIGSRSTYNAKPEKRQSWLKRTFSKKN